MNNLKYWRENNNLTQTELAERSGVSLRTIQRIEAGSPLKGYTLKAIAKTLEIDPENLLIKETETLERAKNINFSALVGLLIPFGGIIFPWFLTSKTDNLRNKQLGKKIIEVQIILTFSQSISLIILPFFQNQFEIREPLFIYNLVLFLMVKLIVIAINGISLNKNAKLKIALKINIL